MARSAERDASRSSQNLIGRFALSALASHLPEELLPEALSVTRQIQDETSRAIALIELAEHLPEALWPEALKRTRQIQDENYRGYALSELARHLPEALLQEALESYGAETKTIFVRMPCKVFCLN